MTRRRRLRVLLALVLGLGARAVYAVPLEAAAELRAVSCCTQHTGQPSSVPGARRCCEITSDAGARATLTAAPAVALSHHLPLVLPVAPSAARTPGLPGLARERRDAPRDGPPLYLGLLAIRR